MVPSNFSEEDFGRITRKFKEQLLLQALTIYLCLLMASTYSFDIVSDKVSQSMQSIKQSEEIKGRYDLKDSQTTLFNKDRYYCQY